MNAGLGRKFGVAMGTSCLMFVGPDNCWWFLSAWRKGAEMKGKRGLEFLNESCRGRKVASSHSPLPLLVFTALPCAPLVLQKTSSEGQEGRVGGLRSAPGSPSVLQGLNLVPRMGRPQGKPHQPGRRQQLG